MRGKVEEDRELHLEKERIRLGRMRDAEIEKTIHVLQTENLLFEKKCSKRFEEGLIRAKVELEEKKNIIQKVRTYAIQKVRTYAFWKRYWTRFLPLPYFMYEQ